LDAVAASPVKNTVVVSGDVHSFWATDLKQDFATPASRTVATEFVGGSVTSQGFTNERIQPLLRDNPHLRYGLGEAYGYGHLALEAKAATVSFRTVDDVRDPKSGIKTSARFAVEAGDPGVKRA
jgi:alkaline phosphatase D